MVKPVALVVAPSRLLAPLRSALRPEGLELAETRHDEATSALRRARPALALVACDADHPLDGIATVRRLRDHDARLPILLLAESSSEALAIAAIKAGVSDYFKVPLDAGALRSAVRGLVGFSRGPDPLADEPPSMIGCSPATCELRRYIERVAATDTSVLITGETGTGKDLVAQLLHQGSPRGQRPFVSINCAAIPDSLLESELFGCERGAFTGAESSRPGHLGAANGGTVFFDEIGEMTPYAQAKVLRALDTHEICRLGSTRRVPLDIRVIAATNQDLDRLVEQGRFRRDLYYRVHVSSIRLQPLRDRREDVPGLVEHYVAEGNRRFARDVRGFTPEALQGLVEYDWPGNVREVRNVVECAFAELPACAVSFLEMPRSIRECLGRTTSVPHDERNRLIAALVATDWNVSRAARQLHWSRMTLYRKLAKHRLTRDAAPHVAS